MNTRASKKQNITLQNHQETRTKQEEIEGDFIVNKVNIENEEMNNKTTTIYFNFQKGIQKLQITKAYPSDKNGFKAHKTRNKPNILNQINSIKQAVDNKLYDILDVNSYIQLMNDQQQSQNIPKFLKCKCNKSMCLKQYCECFANGNMCTIQCQCTGCHNQEQYTNEREEAINKQKTQYQSLEENPIGINCKCKKSQCKKNYCDCFANNQVCNQNCKCYNCENQDQKIEQLDQRLNISLYDENSRMAKSPIICRPCLFRKTDSMNYSNSFGYSRRQLIQQEGPYFLKQDSQGFQ